VAATNLAPSADGRNLGFPAISEVFGAGAGEACSPLVGLAVCMSETVRYVSEC
jgi:hypothetical protein